MPYFYSSRMINELYLNNSNHPQSHHSSLFKYKVSVFQAAISFIWCTESSSLYILFINKISGTYHFQGIEFQSNTAIRIIRGTISLLSKYFIIFSVYSWRWVFKLNFPFLIFTHFTSTKLLNLTLSNLFCFFSFFLFFLLIYSVLVIFACFCILLFGWMGILTMSHSM